MSQDPFDLNRFVKAQDRSYENVLSELRAGSKRSHWMWYIFPQIDGLGSSPTARLYAIKSMEEAEEYLAHPVLGQRLIECSELAFKVSGLTASQVFGYPDDLKFKSSMTLFSRVAGAPSVFADNIKKYFGGKEDTKTLEILGLD